ncbi:MAG: sigma-70 family RNA polymerase sigma factor [Gammaproteobacteria bacterium]|nr:sigma-70 family RNA polymerase sigma factor [Gammaproteobacteria bacterium]
MKQSNKSAATSASKVAALLARIAERDQRAMVELYRCFGMMLLRDALRQLSDRAVAEEVVQDTMLEIWRRPLSFRGESRFSTFLIGIARNKVRAARRKSSRDRMQVLTDDQLLPLLEQNARPQTDLFDEIDKKRLQGRLRRCIDDMPGVHGDCLHLAYDLDMSVKEVAQLQNCPPNTVKTRMFHAREKVRNYLRRSPIG